MQVGSFGFNLILTTKLDLSTTTSMEVRILRPGGSLITKALTDSAFMAPANDSSLPWRVTVPIEDGDLNVAGTYKIQLIDDTTGRSLPSAVGSFNVLPNI